MSASISTQLTTADQLLSQPSTSEQAASTLVSTSASASTGSSLEGWQKSWEAGMQAANIPWAKSDGPHGLFMRTGSRLVLKNQMEFAPPPQQQFGPSFPSMTSFFTTRIFFWRPVGVLGIRIRCPNADCPAPADSYLAKSGFATQARQVRTIFVYSFACCIYLCPLVCLFVYMCTCRFALERQLSY